MSSLDHDLNANSVASTSSIAKSVDAEVHGTDGMDDVTGQESLGPPVEKVDYRIVLDLDSTERIISSD